MSGCPVMADVARHLDAVDAYETWAESVESELDDAVATRMLDVEHTPKVALECVAQVVGDINEHVLTEGLAELVDGLAQGRITHLDIDGAELLMLWMVNGDARAGAELQDRANSIYERKRDSIEEDVRDEEEKRLMERIHDN